MADIRIISLKGRKLFSEKFGKGKKISTRKMFASVYFRTDMNRRNDSRTIRLAVTVGKRTVRLAVARNRIKRLMREAFRLSIDEYTMESGCPFDTVILSWKRPVSHPKLIRLDDVKSEVNDVLSKAFDFYKTRFAKRNEAYS